MALEHPSENQYFCNGFEHPKPARTVCGHCGYVWPRCVDVASVSVCVSVWPGCVRVWSRCCCGCGKGGVTKVCVCGKRVCVCVCYRVPKVCAGVAKVVVGVAMACVWPRCCFVCGQCMWRPSAPPAAATSLPEMHVVVCYPDALFNCCAISVPSSA